MSSKRVEEFRTVRSQLRHEIDRVKGSRFIADVVPVDSPGQAQAELERVRSDFPDASHHCWAYRLGHDGQTYRFSDDGEPGGSAGRSILQQIQGRDLTGLIVVVTRYFGGTKLGIGGLVRAYGGAVAAALDRADVITVAVTRTLVVEHPYDCSGVVRRLLEIRGLKPVAAEYGETTRLRLEVPIAETDEFLRRLRDVTAGRATAELDDD